MGVNGVSRNPERGSPIADCGMGTASRSSGIVDCELAVGDYNNVIFFCDLFLPSTKATISIRPMDSEKIEGTLWEEKNH